jgi:hypothetical protein
MERATGIQPQESQHSPSTRAFELLADIKAEIVWLHHTKPDLSQRAIARMFHVSQPYVARLLKRARLSVGIENAIGLEAYRHYRERIEAQRRAHFQAQGAPASLIGECNACAHELNSAFVEPPQAPSSSIAAGRDALGTEYVELGRSTTGEVVEVYGSAPSWAETAAPALAQKPQASFSQCEHGDLSHVDAAILKYIGFNPLKNRAADSVKAGEIQNLLEVLTADRKWGCSPQSPP